MPSDLHQHRFINHTLRAPPLQVQFDNGEIVLGLHAALTLNDLGGMNQAALAGAGIIVTGACYVQKWIRQGQLVGLLQDYPLGKVSSNIYYTPAQYELNKVRCFVEALCDGNKPN